MPLESPFLDKEALAFDELEGWESQVPPQQGGATVRFPSGVELTVTSGPTGPDEEFHDPNGSNNPLLDVSGPNRTKKVSSHFTAGEFATTAGTKFAKARIDPALVERVQALRDFVRTPLSLLAGFYSWKYLADLSKKSRKPAVATPHLAGQGAKIASRHLSTLELAKAAIIACGADTTITVNPASITIYVKQANPDLVVSVPNDEQREKTLKLLRIYRGLFTGLPSGARQAARGPDLEGLRNTVHWAIHTMHMRDREIIADLAFYTSEYIERSRMKQGRYDPRDATDKHLRNQILKELIVPALNSIAGSPAQTGGGDPTTTKGQTKPDTAQPDGVAFDLTGRYETVHTDKTSELGKTLCVNQAGKRVEVVMAEVINPTQDPYRVKNGYRLSGNFDGKGFQVAAPVSANLKFRLVPIRGGLEFEWEQSGKTMFETFRKVSSDPMVSERAADTVSPVSEQDLIHHWEWMPLLRSQVTHLRKVVLDPAFINGYLTKFFQAEGNLQVWKEHVQAKAVEAFATAFAKRVIQPNVGVHWSDWILVTLYLRQFLTEMQWRPYKTYPYLSVLEWIQRLVAVVEYQCKYHSNRTGSVDPTRFIGPFLKLLNLPQGTALDETLHKYKFTMKISGGLAYFRASILVEKVGGTPWPGGKENFKARFWALGLSIKLKRGKVPRPGPSIKWKDTYIGYAQTALYWLPNDLPGPAKVVLGEIGAGGAGVSAGAQGGFMHLDGRGGLPVMQVIFSETDVDLGLTAKPKIAAEIFTGFGRIFDKNFKDVDYPPPREKTDYAIRYQLQTATHFGFDGALLTEEARQSIRIMCAAELAALVSPFSILVINGHTDSKGSVEYNKKLATLRASNAAQALRDIMGAKLAALITTNAFDEQEAAARGEKEYRNMDRRRVDFILNGLLVLSLRAN